MRFSLLALFAVAMAVVSAAPTPNEVVRSPYHRDSHNIYG